MIGEKHSGYSCQMHRMNANKPVRMLKSAFFRKKKLGEVWQYKLIVDGETDEANTSGVHACAREQVKGV